MQLKPFFVRENGKVKDGRNCVIGAPQANAPKFGVSFVYFWYNNKEATEKCLMM
jgi:hypothetical protein